MIVYVLNKYGKPLMPCSPCKARKLLKQGKAKVKRTDPFIIQLLYGSTGYKQPITLGVDAGSKHLFYWNDGSVGCDIEKEYSCIPNGFIYREVSIERPMS